MTPKQSTKFYSRFDNSTEKGRKSSSNLNHSKILTDKHSERPSSRKKDRDERTKSKSKRSSRTRYNSYKRQNSSKDLDHKPKERGSSAYTRPQSAKEHGSGASRQAPMSAFNPNYNYKNPDEFHKLRHSMANGSKPRRPSSAKNKNESNFKSSDSKHSFLDAVSKNEGDTRNVNGDVKYSDYELKKAKHYESKRSHPEGRKRSSSRDRPRQSPSGKYSRGPGYKNSHRSRSRKDSINKSNNKNTDVGSDRHMAKTRSSTDLKSSNKPSIYNNSTSLKFNNILKDMGAHSNSGSGANLFNYTDKVNTKNIEYKSGKSLKVKDYDVHKSKFS